jgi:hypothetical protein
MHAIRVWVYMDSEHPPWIRYCLTDLISEESWLICSFIIVPVLCLVIKLLVNQKVGHGHKLKALELHYQRCGSECFWASRIRIRHYFIWIRILGSVITLYGSGSLHQPNKKSKKKLDLYNFVTFFDYLSIKADVHVDVPSKSNKQTNFFLNLFL